MFNSPSRNKDAESSDDAILEKISALIDRKIDGLNVQLAGDMHKMLQAVVSNGNPSAEVQMIQEKEDEIMRLKDERHRLETELHNLKRSGGTAAQDSRLCTELDSCKKQLVDAQTEIQNLKSQLTGLSAENEQLKAAEQATRSGQDETERQLMETLSARESELRQAHVSLLEEEAKYSRLEQERNCQLKEYEDILRDKESRLSQAEDMLAAEEQKAYGFQEEITALQGELQEVKSRLDIETERSQSISSDLQHYSTLYEQSVRNGLELEERIRNYEASVANLNAGNLDLQVRIENLAAQNQSLELEIRQSSAASQAQAVSYQTEITNLQSEKVNLQTECSRLTQYGDDLKQQLQTLEILRNRVFPECLSIPSLSTFVQEWRAQLLLPTPDPLVLSMLANIFVWSCAKDAAALSNCDIPAVLLEKDALNGLSNFSRYFFDVLYAAGTSPDDAERLASDLMEKINAELEAVGAKYEVVLPYSGEQYDSRTMVVDNRGSRTGEVYQLRSMGIKSSTGGVMHAKSLVQLI